MLELEDLMPGSATLTLRRGEIVGIAGLLGAGRTRLLRAIFGLEPVTSGRITRRRLLGSAAAARALAAGVGNAQRGSRRRGPRVRVERRRQHDAVAARAARSGVHRPAVAAERGGVRWIDRLGIRCADPRQPARELSGGNQQKVAVARLLHHDVDVLVLDEPTRGIDVASKAQIYRLIDELVRGAGTGTERCRRAQRRCCWSAATCRNCSASAIGSR